MAKCRDCGNVFEAETLGTTKCSYCCVKTHRHKKKARLIEIKGGKCERCGYDKCPDAFDFHHLDPSKKEFNINGATFPRSMEKIMVELEKCVMLCANCHREIHYEQNRLKDMERAKLQQALDLSPAA